MEKPDLTHNYPTFKHVDI